MRPLRVTGTVQSSVRTGLSGRKSFLNLFYSGIFRYGFVLDRDLPSRSVFIPFSLNRSISFQWSQRLGRPTSAAVIISLF